MSIKCIIVDDEPLSQDVIEKYIMDVSSLELVKKCGNAFEAIEVLRNYDIQLIFLDINMPRLSGINFIKSLANPPLIIFITAYPEFAVDGFEVEAIDYILKPFSMERFLKAVDKAIYKVNSDVKNKELNRSYFTIKVDKKLHKINYNDILYFSAIGDYVKVHLKDIVFITHETLKSIEARLSAYYFARTHKSYIVSLGAIQYLEGNRLKVADQLLPVGLTYKEELVGILRNK